MFRSIKSVNKALSSNRIRIGLLFFLLAQQALWAQTTQNQLTGQWQLVRTQGGILGYGHPIKKKTVVEFTPDCGYRLYLNDTLVRHTNYELKEVISRFIHRANSKLGIKREMLVIGNGTPMQSIRVRDSTLVLKQDAADGLTKVFKRL